MLPELPLRELEVLQSEGVAKDFLKLHLLQLLLVGTLDIFISNGVDWLLVMALLHI